MSHDKLKGHHMRVVGLEKMTSTLAKWKSGNFLVSIVFLQFIVYATTFLDIPVVRQVIGFMYFSFIPGFVIIKLLKIKELDRLETVIFAVGLSVAFLMLAGLLINAIRSFFEVARPISFLPLIVFLNGFILVSSVLAHLRDKGMKLWETNTARLACMLNPLALFLIGLPVLTIVGVVYVNAYNSNLILLLMIVIVSLLFGVAVMSRKLLPPKLYPLAIFVIALSLLYHWSLLSNYLIHFASDAAREFFVFRTTLENAYWVPTNPYFGDMRWGRVHSMLSVSILPTIYSVLLNVDPAWVFKVLYPLIFSFVPLGFYKICEGSFGSKYAFISTFFFMSIQTFYGEMLGVNRQMIAELFFVLLIFIILNQKIESNNRMTCFMIFTVGLVISHYATAEIFMGLISLVLILSIALLIVMKRPSQGITVSMVVFFFVVMFSWYIFTSSSAVFDSFVSYGEYVINSLDDFLNPAAREPQVLRGLGLESPPTIWNAVSRVFAYATEILIVAGFIGLVVRARARKIHSHRNFLLFSLFGIVLLALLVLVPGLAKTLHMTRFYQILLFFLAPLCVLGAGFLVGLVFKRKRKLLTSVVLLIVLVPYFLFQTGFVYEVTGSESWSLPLGKHRMNAYKLRGYWGYIDERDVFSALWFSKNVNIQNMQLYIDKSSNVLLTYGMVLRYDTTILSNVTSVTKNGIVHLNRLNVVEGIIVGDVYVWNKTEFSLFGNMNGIYQNGGSEIYRNEG